MRDKLSIAELAKIAPTSDAAFVESFPHPALIVTTRSTVTEDVRVHTPSGGSPINPGKTVVRHDDPSETHVDDDDLVTPRQSFEPAGEAARVSRSHVHFVQKSERNPFGQMITIGRASNNDIIVGDVGVSKLHAYITRSPAGWTITDQGSTNGTTVDGKKLEARTTAKLAEGSVVRFGPDVEARFFLATGLFKFLASVR